MAKYRQKCIFWGEVSKCQSQSVKLWKMTLTNKKVREKFGGFIFISYFCPRLMQVAQPVWAAEAIAFGSAFVSICGKAFISLCF